MRKSSLATSLLTAGVLFSLLSVGRADTISLTISDNHGDTQTVSSVGDVLTFSGLVGNFDIQFAAGVTNSPGGNPSFVSITNNTVTNTGLEEGVLTFALTGFGFTTPSVVGGAEIANSGSFDGNINDPNGEVTVQGFFDANNAGSLTNGTSICAMGPAAGGNSTAGACPAVYASFLGGSGPFSLSEVTTLTLGAEDSVNTTGRVTTAPEPSAILLLGSGLLSLGGIRRRWFR